MTHEEIIAMAREEGLSFVPDTNSPLARIVRKAVAKEREAIQAAWRHFIDLLIELERKKLSTTAPSTLKPEGWHACGNVGMEASE